MSHWRLHTQIKRRRRRRCFNQRRLQRQKALLVSEHAGLEPPAQLASLNDDGTLMCLRGKIIYPLNLITPDLQSHATRDGAAHGGETERVSQPRQTDAIVQDVPLSFKLITTRQCSLCPLLENFYRSKLVNSGRLASDLQMNNSGTN